jgi:hypothetical protein
MVRKIILTLPLLLSLFGCGQKLYRIERDQYGEPLLVGKAYYSFTKKPTKEDLKKIDCTAYYIQVFEGGYYNENEKRNPRIIIFHDDGFFKNESLLYFGKFDKHREKKSVYYGGKYKIVDYKIFLEEFYPVRGDYTKYYKKEITEGKIEGDRIIFKDKNSVTIFEKNKSLHKLGN